MPNRLPFMQRWVRRALVGMPNRLQQRRTLAQLPLPAAPPTESRRSIALVLKWHAQNTPDALAVTEASNGLPEQSLTYAELDARSNRLAHAYAAMLGDNNPIGRIFTLALPNGIELMAAACACWKLGGTPQPIDARMPAGELKRVLDVADPIVTVGLAPMETALSARVDVPLGFEPDPCTPDAIPYGGARVPPYLKAPLSGGSTGRPKVILSTQRGEFSPHDGDFLQTGRGGAMLIPGPMSHNVPFLWGLHGLMQAKHLVIMRKFDAHDALRLIARHRCDYTPMVPTMMQRILQLYPPPPLEPHETHTLPQSLSRRALFDMSDNLRCPRASAVWQAGQRETRS